MKAVVRSRLALIVMLGVVAGVTVPTMVSGQQADADAFADLVPRWLTAMETLHVPGMAVAVVGPDSVRFIETLGTRDLATGAPVTPETMFYIASMTKPFVALATVLLADEGAIVLNRPVRTYLPRFELADFIEGITITVRDLLAHRRGLQDYPITFGEAFSGQMTEERFYRLLKDVEAVGELDYQNLHYTLLGRIIQEVSGLTWQDYLDRNVLRPAGMTRTTTSAAPLTEEANVAVPYEWVGGNYEPARLKTDRTMHAAGGMLSTVEDLARWIQIHLGNGRLDGEIVYPEEVILEMQFPQIFEEDPSPFVPDYKRIGWGLGWDIREDRGMRVIYHGGSYTGWAAEMSFMPEIATGVVILTNERSRGRALSNVVATDIFDRVRGLTPRNVLGPFLAMMGDDPRGDSADAQGEPTPQAGGPMLPLDRYVGSYLNDDWGTVDVWIDDGDLTARIGDLPLPLVWTGPDTFIADGDQEGRFEADDRGRAVAFFLAELTEEGFVRFDWEGPQP